MLRVTDLTPREKNETQQFVHMINTVDAQLNRFIKLLAFPFEENGILDFKEKDEMAKRGKIAVNASDSSKEWIDFVDELRDGEKREQWLKNLDKLAQEENDKEKSAIKKARGILSNAKNIEKLLKKKAEIEDTVKIKKADIDSSDEISPRQEKIKNALLQEITIANFHKMAERNKRLIKNEVKPAYDEMMKFIRDKKFDPILSSIDLLYDKDPSKDHASIIKQIKDEIDAQILRNSDEVKKERLENIKNLLGAFEKVETKSNVSEEEQAKKISEIKKLNNELLDYIKSLSFFVKDDVKDMLSLINVDEITNKDLKDAEKMKAVKEKLEAWNQPEFEDIKHEIRKTANAFNYFTENMSTFKEDNIQLLEGIQREIEEIKKPSQHFTRMLKSVKDYFIDKRNRKSGKESLKNLQTEAEQAFSENRSAFKKTPSLKTWFESQRHKEKDQEVILEDLGNFGATIQNNFDGNSPQYYVKELIKIVSTIDTKTEEIKEIEKEQAIAAAKVAAEAEAAAKVEATAKAEVEAQAKMAAEAEAAAKAKASGEAKEKVSQAVKGSDTLFQDILRVTTKPEQKPVPESNWSQQLKVLIGNRNALKVAVDHQQRIIAQTQKTTGDLDEKGLGEYLKERALEAFNAQVAELRAKLLMPAMPEGTQRSGLLTDLLRYQLEYNAIYLQASEALGRQYKAELVENFAGAHENLTKTLAQNEEILKDAELDLKEAIDVIESSNKNVDILSTGLGIVYEHQQDILTKMKPQSSLREDADPVEFRLSQLKDLKSNYDYSISEYNRWRYGAAAPYFEQLPEVNDILKMNNKPNQSIHACVDIMQQVEAASQEIAQQINKGYQDLLSLVERKLIATMPDNGIKGVNTLIKIRDEIINDTAEDIINWRKAFPTANTAKKLSYYVQHDILKHRNLDEATLAMDKWITIANILYMKKDYDSFLSVQAALSDPYHLMSTVRINFKNELSEMAARDVPQVQVLVDSDPSQIAPNTMASRLERIDDSKVSALFDLSTVLHKTNPIQLRSNALNRIALLAAENRKVDHGQYADLLVNQELANFIKDKHHFSLHRIKLEDIRAINQTAEHLAPKEALEKLLTKIGLQFNKEDKDTLEAIHKANREYGYRAAILNPKVANMIDGKTLSPKGIEEINNTIFNPFKSEEEVAKMRALLKKIGLPPKDDAEVRSILDKNKALGDAVKNIDKREDQLAWLKNEANIAATQEALIRLSKPSEESKKVEKVEKAAELNLDDLATSKVNASILLRKLEEHTIPIIRPINVKLPSGEVVSSDTVLLSESKMKEINEMRAKVLIEKEKFEALEAGLKDIIRNIDFLLVHQSPDETPALKFREAISEPVIDPKKLEAVLETDVLKKYLDEKDRAQCIQAIVNAQAARKNFQRMDDIFERIDKLSPPIPRPH